MKEKKKKKDLHDKGQRQTKLLQVTEPMQLLTVIQWTPMALNNSKKNVELKQKAKQNKKQN